METLIVGDFDPDFNRIDAMAALLDGRPSRFGEIVIRLEDRPDCTSWSTSMREMRGEVRSLKREIRNETRRTLAVEKRRAKQKAQRAARRRNRHG